MPSYSTDKDSVEPSKGSSTGNKDFKKSSLRKGNPEIQTKLQVNGQCEPEWLGAFNGTYFCAW
jgi:hypothetical protein